jgi:hypothetical protein
LAVVISDFEVVVEEPPPAAATSPELAAEPTVLTPPEFELLVERQAERAARVRAH